MAVYVVINKFNFFIVRCLLRTVELPRSVCSMLAKSCKLFRKEVFCLVFRPLIQITAPYERLGLNRRYV